MNGTLSESGSYTNNLKTGDWTLFHSNGKTKEKGSYENNKKAGIWYYYNYNGRISKRYDFDNNEELPITLDDIILYLSLAIYPEEAKEKGLDGEVIASFDVDATCHCSNYKIISSTDEVFNNSVIEAKEIIFEVIHRETKLSCDNRTITVPFKFRLQ